MAEERTKGVENLLGDPKKAVLIMAIPLIISMLAQSINNIIDTVWVAGLDSNAVAATGFVFPVFIIIIGIGNGLGIGASSAISKHIGANDKNGADRVAYQALLLTIIIGAIMTVVILLIERPMLEFMGAGPALDLSIQYARPLLLCSLVFLLDALFCNLLRAEGDSKRAMYTQLLAAGINIVLDPFFIYTPDQLNWLPFGLGMGVSGAAWATVIGIAVALVIQVYWFFISKSTYLDLVHHKFRFHKDEDKEILVVGIPSSFEMFVMSISIVFLNIIIGGNGAYIDNITINTCVWKVINIYMIPLMALSGAVVPIMGASYGANKLENIRVVYMYAAQIGIVLMIICIVISFVFGEQIMTLFTYSESMQALRPQMADVLWKSCLFLPVAAVGFIATGFFQAMGMGMKSLICCIFRNFIQLPIIYALTFVSMSMSVLLWGTNIGEILGSLVCIAWTIYVLRKLLNGELKRFEIADT